MMQKTTTLLGAFGQKNLGDDLILWIFLKILRQKVKYIYVNVSDVSLIPNLIIQLAKRGNIRFFQTYGDWLRKIPIVWRTEVFIFCGGTLLKELYRNLGRNKYSVMLWALLTVWIAKLLRKKVYAFNIGIGPVKTPLGKVLLSLALRAMDLIIVRDTASYNYALNALPYNRANKVIKGVDATFMDTWPSNEGRNPTETINKLHLLKRKGATLLGVNVVYNIKDEVDPYHVASILGQFINIAMERIPDMYIIFFPFQTAFNPSNEHFFFESCVLKHIDSQLKKKIIIIDDLSIENICEYLEYVDIFLGTRFHSLIACVMTNTPFVALIYDEKCQNFLEDIDYPFKVDLEDLSLSQLLTIVNKLYHKKTQIQEILTCARTTMESKGRQLRQIIHKCLN